MSLREITLQNRVDALEEAVEALACTIRTHLPASGGMIENVLSCTQNASKHVEKIIAQSLSAARTAHRARYDRLLDVGQLNEMLKIYVPFLLMYDKEQRFFKNVQSNGPYSYNNDLYELDLSQIARMARMITSPTMRQPSHDVTRMTLHVSCRGELNWYVEGISGTELYNDEWVSYGVGYDGETMALFEKELLEALRLIFKELDQEATMIEPNFNLNGTSGVVHGLTLKHHNWEREAKLLGEPIEGAGVVLEPKNLISDFDVTYRIVLWKKSTGDVIKICVQPKYGESYKLIVRRDSPEVILTTLGGVNARLDPEDVGILTRARFRVLIDFVNSILDESCETLIVRDPTSVVVGWEATPIPLPEDA